jgi:hypothetical protein
MAGFLNFCVLLAVIFTTYFVIKAVDGALYKIFIGLGGLAVFMLTAHLLPNPNEAKRRPAASEISYPYSASAPTELAPTKELTLRNYKQKGDSVGIECSGPTGNITCKPKSD